jgi:DNA repair protein RecN (Recombination protein N)
LRIRDLGVIADATMELGPGLTVVTGETGAGKTMLLSALGLLLGERADSALVRTGADKAIVEGRFTELPPAARDAAEEAGAELDEDGSLIITRSVGRDGRSRATVGGTAVPVAVLSRLATELVRVHGQNDRGLTDPTRQRDALDRFSGAALALRSDYAEAYEQLRAAEAAMARWTESEESRVDDLRRYRDGLAHIDALDPQPGEDEQLAIEAARLGHADALRTAAAAARSALSGDVESDLTSALDLLASAARELAPGADLDPTLGEFAERLNSATVVLADLAADLAGYAASVEADPARLAHVQERQSGLAGLIRSFGPRLDDVLAWADEARRLVDELDQGSEAVDRLRADVQQGRQRLQGLAVELSDLRAAAAQRFAESVSSELQALAMGQARLEVDVSQAEAADGLMVADRSVRFGPSGVDEVKILLSAHRGAPLRPVAKSASGGELSRIMLALEVVFAGSDPVGTFVFDEVDAGVGGTAAVEVGRRLARLAASGQVLVVTHLPQVAAFADLHLTVAKDASGAVGRTDVQQVSGAERATELSRMLAGLPDSEAGRAHAEELIVLADSERALR